VTQDSNIILDFGLSFVVCRREYDLPERPVFWRSIPQHRGKSLSGRRDPPSHPWQVAICWMQCWKPSGTLYTINAGTNQIHTISASTRRLESPIVVTGLGSSAIVLGVFDSAISNGLMYSRLDTHGISVVDLLKKVQVQYLDLEGFGQR